VLRRHAKERFPHIQSAAHVRRGDSRSLRSTPTSAH
jgi:hypothetical protein